MADLATDNTDGLIVADVVAALRAAAVDGEAVFQSVGVYESTEAFLAVQAPAAGALCGVVPGRTERQAGEDNGDEYLARLPISVVVATLFVNPINNDATAALADVGRLVELARAALRADPFRGGLASVIPWGGRLLKATDVEGAAKALPRRAKGTAVLLATEIPVAVGDARAAE